MIGNFCFFHDKCADGLLAGSIFKHHFPDAKMGTINYGSNQQLIDSVDHLTFVDFCPTPEWVSGNLSNFNSLTIFDHHKTSEGNVPKIQRIMDDAKKPVTFHFDMDRSGGHILWDHFETQPLSWRADILARYDLGKPLGELEGFIDIVSSFFDIEDIELRLRDFYTFITQDENVDRECTLMELAIVNKMRVNKFNWFYGRLRVYDVALPWIKHHDPEAKIKIAFTFAPQYMITSFAKWLIEKDPSINLVIGVSLNAATMGLSLRGKQGESYARIIAERFYGGGHDPAAGGVSWTVCGFNKLRSIIESGVFPVKPEFTKSFGKK